MTHELQKQIAKGLIADYALKIININNVTESELIQILISISEELKRK